jgi:hypothetical protein
MQFPHCDARVLHQPGECEYCDKHPDWQELRLLWDISFTGQTDKALPCPADLARGDGHLQWGGNIAFRDGEYRLPEPPQADVRNAMQGLLFILGETND